MCDRKTSSIDPTADFILSDLLAATEDLIDFSINVLDTIRLQTHFNDRNRRVNLAMQLQDALDIQKTDFGIENTSTKPCTVITTLKYDLALYLDHILQACKRIKANLLLLRVIRTRAINTTLLLVASTNVRVEKLNGKVRLLTRLVKENGGEFQIKKKKKKKKKDLSETNIDENVKSESKQNINEEKIENKQQSKKKQSLNLMSKEDLIDYVEIALSFRMIITKCREFIQNIRNPTKSIFSSNGQTSLANSIILVPIATNAINELNSILNRLIRISLTIEAESNSLRQSPILTIPIDSKELYRHDTNENLSTNEMISQSQMLLTEQIGSSHITNPQSLEGITFQKDNIPHQYSSGTNLKRNTYSLLKQNETRSNIRNQSAISSTSKLITPTSSNISSFKLTPNLIANIFEDFFTTNNNLFD